MDKNVSTRDDFDKKVDQRVKTKRLKSKKRKSKKKRRKDNQRKERKATQTLAIVLGEHPFSHLLFLFFLKKNEFPELVFDFLRFFLKGFGPKLDF